MRSTSSEQGVSDRLPREGAVGSRVVGYVLFSRRVWTIYVERGLVMVEGEWTF